jgi:signal transduction histidine kinase
MGTAEILLDEFPKDHPKREFVEILLKETTRLNNTVEEVLQFSRQGMPGREKEDAEAEPLSRVIDRVTSLLDSQLRKKSITLTVSDGKRQSLSCCRSKIITGFSKYNSKCH